MTDFAPIQSPAPQRGRGVRTGIVLMLIALAFLAGIVLAGYLMKRVAWFGGTAQVAKPRRVADTGAAPAGFDPASPLNANGEVPSAVDTGLLATREAALAGQLAALEARTAAVSADAAAAGGQASRAEGLLVAFAARRALDRGDRLGYLEEQLRTRFAGVQPRAVNYVVVASRQPVTLEDLRQGLDGIAADITSVNADNWWDSLERQLGNLVVLRRAGTPSTLPAERLARARRLLDGGQVEAARGEIARLPGAGDASNWMTAANRYVTARHALELIETAALLGQAAPPPMPTPAPATVTAAPALPTAAPTR